MKNSDHFLPPIHSILYLYFIHTGASPDGGHKDMQALVPCGCIPIKVAGNWPTTLLNYKNDTYNDTSYRLKQNILQVHNIHNA